MINAKKKQQSNDGRQEGMKSKSWNIMVLGGTAGMLFLIMVINFLIDPYLHYRKPNGILEYPLKEERYINDGIARNYEYEAMITGTSMSQNFKASQMQQLWQVPTVKTAYSGATFHELNTSIRRALSYNSKLKYVLCSLDGSRINYEAQADSYEGYPEYLYDKNPLNDVKYLLNKEIIPKSIAVVNYTKAGNKTTSMDAYGTWSQYKTFGKEAVEAARVPKQAVAETVSFTLEDEQRVRENVEQNYLQTALDYPEVNFYFFLPPYSIYYWEDLVKTGQLEAQLQAEELAVGLLAEANNVQVYGFADCMEIVGNLDNYMDILHYGEWINEDIMNRIYQGEGRLTKENYQDYFEKVRALYMNN